VHLGSARAVDPAVHLISARAAALRTPERGSRGHRGSYPFVGARRASERTVAKGRGVRTVTIEDEHRDFKNTVEPRRAQTFSRNNHLDVLMSRYPATGSAMAAQCRIVTG
jgi:hypothetical protein